jgi:hypothetical protein
MVGTIVMREELSFVSIDVDFMNKNFNRNFSINDDYGASMAVLSYNGMMLGSKGEE